MRAGKSGQGVRRLISWTYQGSRCTAGGGATLSAKEGETTRSAGSGGHGLVAKVRIPELELLGCRSIKSTLDPMHLLPVPFGDVAACALLARVIGRLREHQCLRADGSSPKSSEGIVCWWDGDVSALTEGVDAAPNAAQVVGRRGTLGPLTDRPLNSSLQGHYAPRWAGCRWRWLQDTYTDGRHLCCAALHQALWSPRHDSYHFAVHGGAVGPPPRQRLSGGFGLRRPHLEPLRSVRTLLPPTSITSTSKRPPPCNHHTSQK